MVPMPVNKPLEASRILAVDDSPDNLLLLETVLDSDAYDLVCVESGAEALSLVTQAPPDLILLDIMMPMMNGYEVTQHIRQDHSLPYIPILLITAHGHTSLAEGLDAGADDFIRKPFDIDELQARIRSLLRMKQAMDAQRAMIRQRDDFVARLTHDLRTPLVAANRMLQLCREEIFGEMADDAKQAIADTMQNNKQLLSMVNTLLEVYRHEAGQKDLTLAKFNLCDMTSTVVKELHPLAIEKALNFVFKNEQEHNTSHFEQFQIQGDAMELRRVITNLIGNAIKFTDKGTVEIDLQPEKDLSQLSVPEFFSAQPDKHSDVGWLVLTVADTGIGIAPEDQAEIFKWFRQGKQRRSGSGLGLHLACRIVEMHGGFIQLSSTPNQGSTFRLYLPNKGIHPSH
ncbi:ATP-binding response regulator [Vacuolonema iberomarrocanum]|uniref:ATP-binding response regulator n=1 Tax=Vacuolonema iberomarrocanum TaxID=3454632 RepID=UPI003F6E2E7A